MKLGLIAHNLNIDLSKTVDGLDETRLPYVQAAYLNKKDYGIWLYTSASGSMHDRMLVLDYRIMQWVILDIEANCITIVKSTDDDGNIENKPWIGSEGGFVYKMLTGNNMGGGSESDGTLSGTITAADATSLTDTGATFYTTDDGHKDVYVYIFDTDGVFQEKKRISTNTSNKLTVAAWDTIPTVGWTYEIGCNKWHRESKTFDFGVDNQKTVHDVLIGFTKVTRETKVKIKFYFAQDANLTGDTSYE